MKENSDAMYVGLIELGTNRSDAIINWSDDAAGAGSVENYDLYSQVLQQQAMVIIKIH